MDTGFDQEIKKLFVPILGRIKTEHSEFVNNQLKLKMEKKNSQKLGKKGKKEPEQEEEAEEKHKEVEKKEEVQKWEKSTQFVFVAATLTPKLANVLK